MLDVKHASNFNVHNPERVNKALSQKTPVLDDCEYLENYIYEGPAVFRAKQKDLPVLYEIFGNADKPIISKSHVANYSVECAKITPKTLELLRTIPVTVNGPKPLKDAILGYYSNIVDDLIKPKKFY